MDGAFALYRYPFSSEYTAMRQECGKPLTLSLCNDLVGKSGFAFAPFHPTAEHPILVLTPDKVERHKVKTNVDFDETPFYNRSVEDERLRYKQTFACFHNKLTSGEFSKIVLSRYSDESAGANLDCEKLFMRACVLYPRMFIALVSMPQCGTWLMATPEILLEESDGKWHTMALAGTMRIDETKDTDICMAVRKKNGNISEWSIKNIREQEYVSNYIKRCLQHYSSIYEATEPYTVRAGTVKHIRSDFYFDIDDKLLGELIDALHPTPAVCGTPKDDTYAFIRQNEAYDRKYYSGFAGPLCCDEGTHLYVTLRCMEINNDKCRLYAGGGLLENSELSDEWLETEAKMDTMRRCLAIKRI